MTNPTTPTTSPAAVGFGSGDFVFGYVADLDRAERSVATTTRGGRACPRSFALPNMGPDRAAARAALTSHRETLAMALVAAGIGR